MQVRQVSKVIAHQLILDDSEAAALYWELCAMLEVSHAKPENSPRLFSLFEELKAIKLRRME